MSEIDIISRDFQFYRESFAARAVLVIIWIFVMIGELYLFYEGIKSPYGWVYLAFGVYALYKSFQPKTGYSIFPIVFFTIGGFLLVESAYIGLEVFETIIYAGVTWAFLECIHGD